MARGDGSANGADATPTVRALHCVPNDRLDDLRPVLESIVRLRGRPLLTLACVSIDDDTCKELFQWREEIKHAGNTGGLDVLIHSPGGVLTSCYRIARFLARYNDEWSALVPDFAASGATLICLGSSEIIMSDIGRLGPIDPQVLSRRPNEFFAGERQSPLEAFQAMKYLREFSLTSLDVMMAFLLEHEVAPKVALETAAMMAIQINQPVLAKLEPYDLGSLKLDSDLAVNYCRRICLPNNDEKKSQRDANFRALVEAYPAHEFIIDIDEAQSLGMNIAAPDGELDTAFDELRDRLQGIGTCIGVLAKEARA